MNFDDARTYLSQLKAKKERKTIWIMAGLVILAFWIMGFHISGLSILLVALWLLPRPGEEIFINRIKSVKAYKKRAFASIFLLFFTAFDVFAVASKFSDTKPVIQIVSQT